MRKFVSAFVFLVAVVCMASAVAQTPGTGASPGGPKLNPIAATSGRGIFNAALLDQAEVRVLRVDVEPGGVRNVHSHDDVRFHIFVPITGTMHMEIEGQKPMDVAPWQAQFLKGGTKHGFTNKSAATVSIMEVFARQ